MSFNRIFRYSAGALLLALHSTVIAANLAYVDARRLVEEAPQGKDQAQELEEAFSERSRELRGKIDQFREEEANLEKNAMLMSAEDRDAKTRELRELQRELRRDQQAFNEEYAARRNEGLQKLERTISEVVIQVSEQGGYDLVVQQAVYASKEIDITDLVLKELERIYSQ
ncbi:MAG: OmpH family outer membrane protein [Pseudomonadota bacterium]